MAISWDNEGSSNRSLLKDLSLIYVVSTVFLGLLIFTLQNWNQTRTAKVPIINSYANDFSKRKAHAEFLSNSRGLIRDGVEMFKGPFRIITTLGSRVILPTSYTEWVKNCPDLDHQALVHHEYFAQYPGFEGIAATTNPDKILIKVAKTKLNQTIQCELVQQQMTEVLQEFWGDKKGWKSIDWSKDAIAFVGRMSASVFVGPELARSPEWQKLIITYTVNTFQGVRALRSWPAIFRPIVHWFLPETKACRQQVQLARDMLGPILDERTKLEKKAMIEGRSPPVYDDTIEWMEEAASRRPFDPIAAQLAFATSALHTTTELLKQTLMDLCAHPKLMEPIREEVKIAVAEFGWTTAGVYKMQLLDSIVKETQRLKPGSLVNLERKVLRDVVLPNGVTLPEGENIAVDSSMMWDASIYPNSEQYDGYRFLKLRQSGSTSAALVSTSTEHIAFGLGRPICPGRFFAANEVKIALAKILLDYDIRFVDGSGAMVVEVGFEMLADTDAKLEVKKRWVH